MFKVRLLNNSEFSCDPLNTIFQGAEASDIKLEHSCLNARCRSCVAKVLSGETENVHEENVLSSEERNEGFVLTCNARPQSDLILEIEDLSDYQIPKSRTIPAKIDSIEYLNREVIKLKLRVPPKEKIVFLSGQYVNLIKGSIKRSYSIANSASESSNLEFLIKKYEGGEMSNYWFHQAKVNDLLRLEGPKGSFFLRKSTKKNLVFLATGTGIAPVKAILESLPSNFDKDVYVFWGGRYKEDLFLELKFNSKVKFQTVLSREEQRFNGYRGYVQNALLDSKINLEDAQIYACGSNEMINSARNLLVNYGLSASDFFSDAFVITN